MPRPDEISTPDALTGHWVDRRAPKSWRPYLRLARFDRPIGTWLLLWPCWWSLALAATMTADHPDTRPWLGLPDLILLAFFAIGAVAMRGAGCVYNDIVDRDLDARVERTRQRPLPAGLVSLAGAWAFLIGLALIGLAVLLTFNRFSIVLGLGSIALVAAYPFMKRVTWWPQAWLGLTFNYGALLGWASVWADLGWPAVALYAAGLFWTLGYDTIYAHQDKEDDALVGIRSSARRLAGHSRRFLWASYAATVALLGLAAGLVGTGWAFWIGLVAAACHLGWQAARVRFDDPAHCLAMFRTNHRTGAIIFLALVVGSLAA
ncbi:MAG: 4-hydroxybenzoate octaprenyltransferase [Alphaproteobacteria bacterium]|nr:4-hydroxybenzoate octaprenyltransferase [Alphaproteobacteria bacterium]